MQKIVPHLWYDKEALEAAEFYAGCFEGASIKNRTVIPGTPSGDVDMVTMEIKGQQFVLISAGPYFRFTPAVSFLVACESVKEAERLWAKLGEGGAVMMPFGEYPFGERYGWLQDRFGLSWQVIYRAHGEPGKAIVPTMMFTGRVCGKAEEAIGFYTSLFRDARTIEVVRYGADEGPNQEHTVKHATFVLENQYFAAVDSALPHDFSFNEAVSFIVYCDTQQEIDYYWQLLSAFPDAEQCGWLKDRYGVSWQIVPRVLQQMMQADDVERISRVTAAFLAMKKLEIAVLEKAARRG